MSTITVPIDSPPTVPAQLPATVTERSALRTITVLVQRNVLKARRVPTLLVFSLAMPLMMLVLFSQVFGTIENSPNFPVGVDYIDFVVPAILAAAVVMNASNSGVGIAIDLQAGVVDRIRSLPVKGWTILAARSVTDTVISVMQIFVVTAVAMVALGFRFQGSALEALGMVGVLIPFSWAFTWLFLFVGARLRDPETAQLSGMMIMMPLMFVSAAFAPVETFPGWLEATANLNPMSLTVEAARGFALGTPAAADTVKSLASSGVVAALGILAASRAYRSMVV
ncbi:MAG: ABC-2 type transport system permease protein [Candidatus Poriferisodalaceae bacterium]|jgi:ABC-2 type transport system permease protein